MFGPWIEKAWRMQREPECLSNVAILKAALSLEQSRVKCPTTIRQRSFRFAIGARAQKDREGAAYTA
jgi:hypothetical protein